MKAVIIEADDWQALYINGESVEQDHKLGNGDFLLILKIAEKYGFTADELSCFWAEEEDLEEAYDNGCFPHKLSELKGTYE